MKKILSKLPENAKIVIGHAAGAPDYLLQQLVKYRHFFKNAEIYHMIDYTPYPTLAFPKHFKHKVFFIGQHTRPLVNALYADYIPIHFSDVPKFIRQLKPDLALVQVAVMDPSNLGVSWDYTFEAVENSTITIAQQNILMPILRSMSDLDPDYLDLVITRHDPLVELTWRPANGIDDRIAKYVVNLIPKEATLQVGNGALPDLVMRNLLSPVDINSEMIGSWFVPLLKRKKVNKAYGTFIAGSFELYRHVNRNKILIMDVVDEINGINRLQQIDNLISVNSAVSVDLFGQVCAETIEKREYSGVGGQVDFVRGANASHNGRSIIALHSLTKTGTTKIIPFSESVVTTTRNDVDTVITEYGVAELKYKTTQERKEALINIAHPRYRKWLNANSK